MKLVTLNQRNYTVLNMVSSSQEDPDGTPSSQNTTSATAQDAPPSPPAKLKASSFSAISEKLDPDNYLLWCQQVEMIIKAHKLHHYLINPTISEKFLTVADATMTPSIQHSSNGNNKINYCYPGSNQPSHATCSLV